MVNYERVMVDNGELWLIIWLVVWNMTFMILLTFHILGMSSSQLTNIFQTKTACMAVFAHTNRCVSFVVFLSLSFKFVGHPSLLQTLAQHDPDFSHGRR